MTQQPGPRPAVAFASTRRPISRRRFLRGAGVALALPPLEAMQPPFARAAEKTPPRRLFAVCNNLGLLPGRSLVVQQDYLYSQWVAWLHVTMEFYADYFEYVCDTGVNSVVFRNTRAIPESVLRPQTVESLTTAEKTALMDRAAGRFEGKQRELILSAKAEFLQMLNAS